MDKIVRKYVNVKMVLDVIKRQVVVLALLDILVQIASLVRMKKCVEIE